MTPDEIRLIEERCSKATLGPWAAGRADMATLVDDAPSKWIYAGDKYLAVSSGEDIEPWGQVVANAEFIAHARTDLPALVQEVKRLTEERAEQETLLRASRAGQPLGPLIGAITLEKQDRELAVLRADNARLREDNAALLSGLENAATALVSYGKDCRATVAEATRKLVSHVKARAALANDSEKLKGS